MPRLSDLLDARARRKRELLEELRPLGQDAATPEMQSAAYREALTSERASVEAQILRLQMLDPGARASRPWEPEGVEPPTAAQRVARAQIRLSDIDAELKRTDG